MLNLELMNELADYYNISVEKVSPQEGGIFYTDIKEVRVCESLFEREDRIVTEQSSIYKNDEFERYYIDEILCFAA